MIDDRLFSKCACRCDIFFVNTDLLGSSRLCYCFLFFALLFELKELLHYLAFCITLFEIVFSADLPSTQHHSFFRSYSRSSIVIWFQLLEVFLFLDWSNSFKGYVCWKLELCLFASSLFFPFYCYVMLCYDHPHWQPEGWITNGAAQRDRPSAYERRLWLRLLPKVLVKKSIKC